MSARVIVEQYAEEVVFLWDLRDTSMSAPHYSLKDLERFDGRVEPIRMG